MRRAKDVILEDPPSPRRRMPLDPSSFISFLLKKAGPLYGPLLLALGLGAFGAWKAREVFDGGQDIRAKVQVLDTSAVTHSELQKALGDVLTQVKGVSTRQEETNRLLNRVICQKQTIVLCQDNK